jgi:hypothetical protein
MLLSNIVFSFYILFDTYIHIHQIPYQALAKAALKRKRVENKDITKAKDSIRYQENKDFLKQLSKEYYEVQNPHPLYDTYVLNPHTLYETHLLNPLSKEYYEVPIHLLNPLIIYDTYLLNPLLLYNSHL